MIDYQKGKIYKMTTDSDPNLVYYGSTCMLLCDRMANHRGHFKKGTLKCTSREILKFGNAKICLVEKCPCDTKEELYARERFYIENNNCVNKIVPGIVIPRNIVCAKSREKHRDDINEKKKIAYQKNKEARKQEYEDNKGLQIICECGGTYNNKSKNDHLKTKKHLNL